MLRRVKTALKGLRTVEEPEVVEPAPNTVWVSCTPITNHEYLHIVMPEKFEEWNTDTLVTFQSKFPRTGLLSNLKAFFDRTASQHPLSFTDLDEVAPDKDGKFEAYLDKVSGLPNHLQAVTTILRLHPGNPHQEDFSKNLAVAEKHHSQWAGVDLSGMALSEMYLEPLASQWGENTWNDVNKMVTIFSKASVATQRRIVASCSDSEYRRYLHSLVNLTHEQCVDDALKVDSVRKALEAPVGEASGELDYRRYSSSDWILHLPLEYASFREAILDLSLYELSSLSALGQFNHDLPEAIWNFNARRMFANRRAESLPEAHSRYLSIFRERLDSRAVLKANHAWRNREGKEFLAKFGFYQFFVDCVEAIPPGDGFWKEYERLQPAFYEPKSWHWGPDFATQYIISELLRVTESTTTTVEILKQASSERLKLTTEDWINFISRYDEVRGMDVCIAVTLICESND